MEEEARWIRRVQMRRSRPDADRLVRRYYDEIFVYALRQLGERETAMDLTQDIFVSMLQSIDGYDPRKASFRTWLYRVATNKIIDHRRRAHPIWVPWEDVDIADHDDLEIAVERSDLVERILRYVDGLDPGLQQVLRLRHFADLGFADIAASLGQPEATVKTRYYRLLACLRKEFSNDSLPR